MSRRSSTSSLSPSATSGSNRIDLGKDSGVDMGRKSQVSATAGGIGVTTEVTNIGGVSVTGGVSVDVSPIGLDVSADPAKGEISVAGSAEIPGGIVGVGGGVTVDTSTGQIKGGSISGEIGGFGVEISKTDERVGLGISYQIPFTPITVNIGFGPKKEEKKPTATPSPTPTPTPQPIQNPEVSCLRGKLVLIATTFLPNAQGFYRTAIDRFGDALASRTKYETFYAGYNEQEDIRKANLRWGAGNWTTTVQTRTETFATGYWDYWPNDINPSFISVPRFIAFPRNDGAALIERSYFFLTYYSKADPNRTGYTFSSARTGIELKPLTINPAPPCPFGPAPILLPPPNPPPRKQMDECCRTSVKLLRAIYLGLGIQKFPGKLPATIVQEVPEEGAQPTEPPQEPIADWVDLFMWNFRRDDERWGQWQIQINVKDTDLTKEGDQSKQIKFPNLAESIAKMEGQILSIQTTTDALLALQTKCLVESGMARQEAMKSYLVGKALTKYFAFKTVEKDFPYPMSFTIGAEKISDLVEESEGHVVGIDYEEKETVRDIFADLLQAAAIVRAVHWQRIDPKKDTKSQLLELLKGSVQLANTLNSNSKSSDGKDSSPDKDWEDFLDEVEDGFRNSTGISDIQSPYGRTPDRRPRIRQIGDNIAQAGG